MSEFVKFAKSTSAVVRVWHQVNPSNSERTLCGNRIKAIDATATKPQGVMCSNCLKNPRNFK